jgi:hypothetical protein
MWRLKHARKGLWGKMPDHKKSAVAVTTFEGKEIYGPNSKHHKYRSDDRLRADHAIEDLVKKYPLDFKTADITRFPQITQYVTQKRQFCYELPAKTTARLQARRSKLR